MVEGKPPRSNYCYMETLYPKTQMAWSELRAMRTDEWKLIVAPRPELCRFSDDKGETRNVVGRFPADADALKKTLLGVSKPSDDSTSIQPQLVSDERRRELNALGYVGAGRHAISIYMSGPDPKDRVAILGGLERASQAMNHDRWQEAVPVLEKISREDAENPGDSPKMLHSHLKATCEPSGDPFISDSDIGRYINFGPAAETAQSPRLITSGILRRDDVAGYGVCTRLLPADIPQTRPLGRRHLPTSAPRATGRARSAIVPTIPRFDLIVGNRRLVSFVYI